MIGFLDTYDLPLVLAIGIAAGFILRGETVHLLRTALNAAYDRLDEIEAECDRLNVELNANVVPMGLAEAKRRHPSGRGA